MKRIKLGVTGSRVQTSLRKKKFHMWRTREQSRASVQLTWAKGEVSKGWGCGPGGWGVSTQMLTPHSPHAARYMTLNWRTNNPILCWCCKVTAPFPEASVLAAWSLLHKLAFMKLLVTIPAKEEKTHTHAHAQAHTEDEAPSSSVLKIKSGARGRGGAGEKKVSGGKWW